MNDFGKEFSIIHRYSRVYMSKLLMEYNIPGRAVPYFMEICAHPGISRSRLQKSKDRQGCSCENRKSNA